MARPSSAFRRRSLGRRLRQVPIGVRLALLMALLLAASTGAFAAVSLVRQQQQAMEAVSRDGRRLAESVERALRVHMLEGHTRFGETFDEITRDGGVAAVQLIRHRGQVRYATRPERVGAKIPLAHPACQGCHPDGRRNPVPKMPRQVRVRIDDQHQVASSVVPVLNAAACSRRACHPSADSEPVLGLLQVDVSFGQVQRTLDGYRNQMILLILAITAATSTIVILLVRHWVGRPVAELLRGTRYVARGDLTHPIEVREGELGELAAAFNQMQLELSSTQRQIVDSEKLASVGKLAAGVAHEINNPLTGVLTFAEELLEDAAEDDPNREDYEVIRNEALRCREIVRNLLDFARPQQPTMANLSLADVIGRTLKLVARLAPFHNAALEVDLPPDLPRVRGDAVQLQQVFLNLLVNAAEAMPSGGTLFIRGGHEPEEDVVRLEFADTGTGIPNKLLPRIFEPFFSTKAMRASGHGLGLAVSWRIIDQHGGRLEVESVPGEGTTFFVRIPAWREGTASERREVQDEHERSRRRSRGAGPDGPRPLGR